MPRTGPSSVAGPAAAPPTIQATASAASRARVLGPPCAQRRFIAPRASTAACDRGASDDALAASARACGRRGGAGGPPDPDRDHGGHDSRAEPSTWRRGPWRGLRAARSCGQPNDPGSVASSPCAARSTCPGIDCDAVNPASDAIGRGLRLRSIRRRAREDPRVRRRRGGDGPAARGPRGGARRGPRRPRGAADVRGRLHVAGDRRRRSSTPPSGWTSRAWSTARRSSPGDRS